MIDKMTYYITFRFGEWDEESQKPLTDSGEYTRLVGFGGEYGDDMAKLFRMIGSRVSWVVENELHGGADPATCPCLEHRVKRMMDSPTVEAAP